MERCKYTWSNTTLFFAMLFALIFSFSIATEIQAADDDMPYVTTTSVTPTKLTMNRINTVTVTFGFEDINADLRGGNLTLNLQREKGDSRFWVFSLTDKVFDKKKGTFSFQLSITPEEDDRYELSFWLRDSSGNNGGNESEYVYLDVNDKVLKKKQGRKKGETAYDFSLIDQTGKPVSLSDYKGKVVLIDFCTMWCNPCKKGTSALKKWEADYGEEGLVILTIMSQNADGQPPTANECKEWAKTYGLNSAVLADPLHGVYEAYSSKEYVSKKTVPRNVIIDRDGVVRWSKFGYTPKTYKQMERTIKKLLKK